MGHNYWCLQGLRSVRGRLTSCGRSVELCPVRWSPSAPRLPPPPPTLPRREFLFSWSSNSSKTSLVFEYYPFTLAIIEKMYVCIVNSRSSLSKVAKLVLTNIKKMEASANCSILLTKSHILENTSFVETVNCDSYSKFLKSTLECGSRPSNRPCGEKETLEKRKKVFFKISSWENVWFLVFINNKPMCAMRAILISSLDSDESSWQYVLGS